MSLELVIGPMYAGKSTYGQSIAKTRMAIGWNVLVLKHAIDKRYLTMTENSVVISHDKLMMPALACESLMGIVGTDAYSAAKLVIVEEGQFFQDVVEFALKAVEQDKKHVVVIGLNGDVHRKPFRCISELEPLADKTVRLDALCKTCGDGTPAVFTKAITVDASFATLGGKPNVGGSESYMPVCRRHYLSDAK